MSARERFRPEDTEEKPGSKRRRGKPSDHAPKRPTRDDVETGKRPRGRRRGEGEDWSEDWYDDWDDGEQSDGEDDTDDFDDAIDDDYDDEDRV